MIRKVLSATAAIVVLAAVTISDISASTISAASAIVYEAETGTVLFEKDPDARMLIASTTKIMTALVAIENSSRDELVTITAESAGVEGSSMYLRAGEEMRMETLLYGLMLESGNDAAVAIAIHVSGSVEAFADLMNKRAQEIGCENTQFVNPNGLNAEGHYSSARDLALIMAEAMKNETFKRIVSTKDITIEGRSFTNHNKLLWSYEGMVGGKTGYTMKAGRTLVTCAQRDGMTLVCVTLNDPDDWNDHVALLDEAFSQWQINKICISGDIIRQIPVISGVSDTVGITVRESKKVLLPDDSELSVEIQLPSFVYGGVEAGDVAGELSAYVNGDEVYSTELVYSQSVAVDLSEKLNIWERLKRSIIDQSAVAKLDG